MVWVRLGTHLFANWRKLTSLTAFPAAKPSLGSAEATALSDTEEDLAKAILREWVIATKPGNIRNKLRAALRVERLYAARSGPGDRFRRSS